MKTGNWHLSFGVITVCYYLKISYKYKFQR